VVPDLRDNVGAAAGVMLAGGIVMVITATMGCTGAAQQSRTALCCYLCLIAMCLIFAIAYLSIFYVLIYALKYSTVPCNFNPEKSGCEEYRNTMNFTMTLYGAQYYNCIPEMQSNGNFTCTQNDDDFFLSMANSPCPEYPIAVDGSIQSAADLIACTAFGTQIYNELISSDDSVLEIGTVVAYFCSCPARFTDGYIYAIALAAIPGWLQGGVVLLLIFSACLLMCLPKYREEVRTRYYVQQQPQQQAAPGPGSKI